MLLTISVALLAVIELTGMLISVGFASKAMQRQTAHLPPEEQRATRELQIAVIALVVLTVGGHLAGRRRRHRRRVGTDHPALVFVVYVPIRYFARGAATWLERRVGGTRDPFESSRPRAMMTFSAQRGEGAGRPSGHWQGSCGRLALSFTRN